MPENGIYIGIMLGNTAGDLTPGGGSDVLLQEDGTAILQENGDFILLE